MDADRAACQILDAVRNRRPELTITFAARLAAIAQALLPNVTADLMKLDRPLVTSNASSIREQDLHWLGKRIVFLSFFAHANC